MQEFEFVDNRRVLWFVGIIVFVAGVLAAFLIVPAIGRTPGMGGSDIHLPKIGSLPPQDAPKLPLEGRRDHEAYP